MAKKKWAPKRVRNEDDRGSGSSDFINLDEGEKFLGYALFEGDPAKDEPGYYEFLQHWVPAAKRSIPCAGDDCPLCEDGDKPKDVAYTLWLVTKDAKGNLLGDDGEGELRIFRCNSILIKQLTEMRSEDEAIKGVQFRVTRMDDRGNYMLQPKTKKLKASQVKELVKSKEAPDFDGMVTSSLQKAMEGLAVARAMDDDDDDDDEPKKKRDKKSKDKKADKKSKKGKSDDDDDDDDDDDTGEWPDDGLDEATVTVKKIAKDGNWIEVESDDYEGTIKVWTNDDIEFDLSDLSKGDEVIVSTGEKDGDGEYILSEEPVPEGDANAKTDDDDDDDSDDDDDDDGDDDNDDDDDDDDDDKTDDDDDDDDDDSSLPDAIEDETFEVVKVDTAEQTIDLKNEELELEFTLYFLDKGPASEVDFDDYEPGMQVKVSAEQDSQGDMVATAVPEAIEKKAKKKSGDKKSKSNDKKSSDKKSSAKKDDKKKKGGKAAPAKKGGGAKKKGGKKK